MASGRRYIDPPSKCFEDFELGDHVVTRGRTVDVGDITNFAGLTGDYYPLHMDEEFGKANRFGTRIAHGPLTFSIAVGLVGMSGFYGDAITALIEIQELRATKPVVAGDTLKVHAAVIELSPTHNAKYGKVGVNYSVVNQSGDEVMNFRQFMLARRRKTEEAKNE
jgi:3-hydroxybutyryl-CoA dehydratase